MKETPTLPPDSALSPSVRAAIRYLCDHVSERVTLSDAAGAAALTPNYLSALIHRETGLRFSDLALRMKIERACALLADPAVKVYEVGLLLGYEEYGYFYQAFRKAMGCSPREYRARNV